MKTADAIPGVPAELKADVRAALAQLARGVRDQRAAQTACERMDRMREENRRLFGEQTIAVALIREGRKEQ